MELKDRKLISNAKHLPKFNLGLSSLPGPINQTDLDQLKYRMLNSNLYTIGPGGNVEADMSNPLNQIPSKFGSFLKEKGSGITDAVGSGIGMI